MTIPITLLTDFGWQDVYVGVMKGVILSIMPDANPIDLTHAIPPHDLPSARFHLLNAVPHFPSPTVHIAVVDPGVGSHRRGVAIAYEGGFLVGPDNGIFSGVLDRYPAYTAVQLNRQAYWYTDRPSTTFHGRDIFAPVGAHLAAGVSLEQVGEQIAVESLAQLGLPPNEHGKPVSKTSKFPLTCEGYVQAIDRFGNVISSISEVDLPMTTRLAPGRDRWAIVGKYEIPLKQTYSDVAPGELVALIGSHGWLEVASNRGNAAAHLQVAIGDRILLRYSSGRES